MASPWSWRNNVVYGRTACLALWWFGFTGCQTHPPETSLHSPTVPPPVYVERTDDLIIVTGQSYHTGTRVITWQEEGGFNAYDFVPTPEGGKENHGVRRPSADAPPPDAVDLAGLQMLVDQFVLHYDSEGFSHRTFPILQKRGLSAHFLLDVDGTLYQTLDLRERAYHATIANSRSIGIEIAHPGAYPATETKELEAWYESSPNGETRQRITGEDPVFARRFVVRPVRSAAVAGIVNGQDLRQYDFTAAQYAALIKLTAALHRIFPRIALDYPRDQDGQVRRDKLSDEEFENFNGVLGHHHIQVNKVDPGPAFQWDLLIDGAREALRESESITH